MYGACGNKSWCGLDDECLRGAVLAEYKFLLAFEPTMCKDHVTEDFYQALKKGVVPVVLGSSRNLIRPL